MCCCFVLSIGIQVNILIETTPEGVEISHGSWDSAFVGIVLVWLLVQALDHAPVLIFYVQ